MKKIICWLVGHDKEHFFAAPNIKWDCRRCGKHYFKKGKFIE